MPFLFLVQLLWVGAALPVDDSPTVSGGPGKPGPPAAAASSASVGSAAISSPRCRWFSGGSGGQQSLTLGEVPGFSVGSMGSLRVWAADAMVKVAAPRSPPAPLPGNPHTPVPELCLAAGEVQPFQLVLLQPKHFGTSKHEDTVQPASGRVQVAVHGLAQRLSSSQISQLDRMNLDVAGHTCIFGLNIASQRTRSCYGQGHCSTAAWWLQRFAC
eukprot:SAG31_NODE_8418_length_1455_cov_2.064159_2_plen_214_part_00